jgi:heparosan-N-sulfate-glucuronate 5-epimerase
VPIIRSAIIAAHIITSSLIIGSFSSNSVTGIGLPIPIPTIVSPPSSQLPPPQSPSDFSAYSGSSMLVDDKGIPYVDYRTIHGIYIGPQRNPVTTSIKALDYYNEYKKTGAEILKIYFINNANWIVETAVYHPKGDFSILQYNFPWPFYNIESPWRSGMAQALAIQVLVKAHELTNNAEYLGTAKLLLNSFFVDVKSGGVTYKEDVSGEDRISPAQISDIRALSGTKGGTINDLGNIGHISQGWWYEEYAADNQGSMVSKVLNGMMFSVLGIYDYYQYTKDPEAKFLFDNGILALRNDLLYYDNNGLSYYDILKTPASEKYHKIHVELLQQLYDITGDHIFKDYHDKWNSQLYYG